MATVKVNSRSPYYVVASGADGGTIENASVKIVQVTGTGTAATGDQDVFEQKIEGQDLVSAGWGQSNAKNF